VKILTWPTEPRYLKSLLALPHEVHVMPLPEVRRLRFDCILFHEPSQYLDDQFELLSAAQRRLPKIYLEHEPPREHPVDSRHVVNDSDVLVVHVSAFNRVMWDNGAAPTRVIEPGVSDAGETYCGTLARGLALAEDLGGEARRCGLDILATVRRELDVDCGALAPHYRFLFAPARYSSPSLALIEALMSGMPVVALASAGMTGLVSDGVNGHVDADPARLVERMRELLADREAALELGREARRRARERFSLQRFVADWNDALTAVTGARRQRFAA
jgi:Glycosyl transferases group 1